jgi:hypothetical protein
VHVCVCVCVCVCCLTHQTIVLALKNPRYVPSGVANVSQNIFTRLDLLRSVRGSEAAGGTTLTYISEWRIYCKQN